MQQKNILIDPILTARLILQRLYRSSCKCKRIDYILEGYCQPPNKAGIWLSMLGGRDLRKVRENPYDVAVAKILRTFSNYGCEVRELGSATSMIDLFQNPDCSGRPEIIVTGLRVPGSFKSEDQIRYTKELARISGKCRIFVVTSSQNTRALKVLRDSRIQITYKQDLEWLMTDLTFSLHRAEK